MELNEYIKKADELLTDDPDYYPAEVAWHESWQGLTFRDMPGYDFADKKLNFFLFRRGLYHPAEDRTV